MNLTKKQNLIVAVSIIIIVSIFSIANYINKQKIYILSNEESNYISKENKDMNNNNMNHKNIHDEVNEYETNFEKIVVHVEGEVVSPGVYELKNDTRVLDAIKAAGGLLNTADSKKINLAKKIFDEEYIYIPNKNDEHIEDQNIVNLSVGSNSIENKTVININKASLEELKKLSGVGDVLASRIIEYRTQSGGFKSIDDLKDVSGIGDKKFIEIKDKITVK